MKTRLLQIALLNFFLGASLARAGLILPFALTDNNRDTGWSILYDTDQISNLVWVGNAGAGTNKGTLSYDILFNSFAPISIEFVESALEQAKAASFGLRFTLNENITNNSKVDWSGFRFDLDDPKRISPQGDALPGGSHWGKAHFHNDAGQTFNPLARLNQPNSDNFILLGTGIFPSDNDPRAWKGVGIHQYEDMNVNRDFTLIQTPIPEPSSALFGAVLALVAGGQALRRRRPHGCCGARRRGLL